MNFIFKVAFFTVCFFSSLSALNVRVLLRDDQTDPWRISSLKGVVLRDAHNQDRVFPKTCTAHALTIQKEDQYIRVNGKKISSKLAWIDPVDKYLTIDGKTYDGRFLLAYEKSKWLLINVIDSEEYLYSVLKTESWPGWPLEVNKGFAIACRSYLLHQLLSSRDRDSVYHIKSTNYHQTYQGIHDDKVLRQAIEETRGVFLAHNQQPILAMFDCCCGGVIPAKIANGMDFSKVPYLARKNVCTFCKGTKLYEWKATYTLEQFTSIVQESRDHIVHPIRDITIAHKDKAGLVKKVTVKTKRDFFTVTARQMNLLFKGVKSYCFSVLKRGKTITVNGKGYGHHLGMCQWGAREMVRQGWSHKDILQFYYPDTYFMQLVLGDSKAVA
jgi:stage II sporulation protein D